MSTSHDDSTSDSDLIGTEGEVKQFTRRASAKSLFAIPLALFLSVLIACSGDSSRESTVGQPSSGSDPSTESGQEISPEEATLATDVGSSSETTDLPQLTLRFKDYEGWSWRITVRGGPNFLSAVKVVETSPPGKATGNVVLNPYSVTFENLDTGRVAPEFKFALLISFDQPVPSSFYGQEFYDGCYTQASDSYANSPYAICEIGWKNLDGGLNTGFHMLGGPATSYELDEYEEATIDSIVSMFNGPARWLYIAVPGTWGCVFTYDFSTTVWTDNDRGCEILGQPSDGSSDANESESDDEAEAESAEVLAPVECDTFFPNESLPLNPCQKGEAIESIQWTLNEMGFAVEIDGYYGQSTFDAVAEFQRQVGLDVTGTIDEVTFEQMDPSARDDSDE